MTKTHNVAVIVGSLRKDSLNRKAALALAKLAPANLASRSSRSATCRFTTRMSKPPARPKPWARFRERA